MAEEPLCKCKNPVGRNGICFNCHYKMPAWDAMPEADLTGIQFPEDPDPTGLIAMVGLHKELWQAYRDVGFTRSEAIELTCMAVTVMAMDQSDHDA